MGEKQKRPPEDRNDSDAPVKKRKKKIPNFSVEAFSKSLRQDACFKVLQKFVHSCESSREDDPAVLFLQGGGKFSDVLNVLSRNFDAHFQDISTVFAAVRLLILRTLTHVQEQRASAEDSCQQLLGHHLSFVYKLLNANSAFCQKVVLELLTAIVMLSPKLACKVLKHINFEPPLIGELTRPADAAMKGSPRQCFIHFLMAFLVEGNVVPIRMLLEKKKLFTSIFPGLQYDKSDLVVFALVTMKAKLVECIEISKTLKMRTFNTQVMLSLLKLYQWMGPSKTVLKQTKRKSWQKGAKKKDLEIAETEVDEGQRETVVEAVHALLLVLCSSIRYGILFRDPAFGTGSQPPNSLATTVLEGLSEPWKHKLLVELIVNMVNACSELSQHVFSKVTSYIEPRAEPSWLRIIDYVTQVVAAVNVKPLFNMDSGTFEKACEFALLPRALLITVCKPGLQHSEPAVRLAVVRFLNEVLCNVVEVHTVRKTWAEDANNLILQVASFCPTDILVKNAWNAALANKNTGAVLPVPTKEQQMLALADLLALYQQSFPLLIRNPLSLGSTLVQTLLLDSIERDTVRLQVKVVKILADLEDFWLFEDKQKFLQVITLLLETASGADISMVREAQAALSALLVDSSLLELPATDTGRELSVWLYCYNNVVLEDKPLVLAFLREVIMQAVRGRQKYITEVLQAQECVTHALSLIQEEARTTTADKIFTDLLKISDSNTTADNGIAKADRSEDSDDLASSLSILFMAAVDIASQKALESPVEKFLSCVLVHLLHLQVHPQQFLRAVNRWKNMPQALACYMQGWGGTEAISALQKQFGKMASSFSHLLLTPTSAVPEVEDCSDPMTIILLTRLIVFHVVQLTKEEKLSAEVCESGFAALTSLLSAAQEIDRSFENSKVAEEPGTTVICLKIIFNHPLLLKHFSPLCKKKQHMNRLVTDFILDILITTFKSLSEIYEQNFITFPLKKKLLRDIFDHLQNPEKIPSKKKTLVLAVEHLSLSHAERQEVITNVVPFLFTAPWTDLLSSLLKSVGVLPSSVLNSLGDILIGGLQTHINEEKFSESGIINSMCQYLENFPFATESISDELFEIAMKCGCSDLAAILLKHKPSLVPNLASLVVDSESSLLSCPDLLFPCLDASKTQLPVDVLNKVYEQYRKQIKKVIKPPFSGPEYLIQHPDLIQQLIVQCMDPQVCKSCSQLLTENLDDLESLSEQHLTVVHALRLGKGWEGCGALLAQLLVQQLVTVLKAQESSSAHLASLCTLLKDHLGGNDIEWGEDPLELSSNVKALPPLLLQSAFTSSDIETSVQLLYAFAYLVNRVKDPEYAEIVFEMAISHSQFLNILLAKEEQGLKLAVLVLLYTCSKVSPNVMKTTHVPVWLGAYGATLSQSDQMLLKLLHRYESSGLSLYTYRPFLWGETAISHYSVRSNAGMSLWRIPQGSQALELLEREIVENTIVHFPYGRDMLQQDNEDTANSAPEKPVLELVLLEKNRPNVYDPAFIMPLLSHVLAPEMVVKTFNFFRSGAMALTLAALGSQSQLMRAAAVTVLARYLSRLESSRPSQFTAVIIQFVEMVRTKLYLLSRSRDSKEPEANHEAPRVPSLSATFLAKAALVLLLPNHPLFTILHFLLLLKPIEAIPGVMLFLRVGKENYRTYQYWMLECIRDGLKTMRDISSISRHYTALQSLFSSSLSNTYIQSLVLQILEVTACIRGSRNVVMQPGLLPWLFSALEQIKEQGNSAVAMGFVRLVVILQDSLPELSPLSTPLLKLLPRNLSRQNLLWVLKFAQNTVNSFTSEQMLMLFHWCYPVLGSTVISKYAEQLCFIGDKRLNVFSEENELPGFLDENVSPKKVIADDDTLVECLKSVVLMWLRR